MSDLISRSALLKRIAHHTMFDCLKRATFESANAYEQTKGAMFDLAQKAPAVDAVPVVRCKDCKYFKWGDYCTQDKMEHSKCRPDEFCSCGEKKDVGVSDDED